MQRRGSEDEEEGEFDDGLGRKKNDGQSKMMGYINSATKIAMG